MDTPESLNAETCLTCDGTGQIWLGSQPYGIAGEAYGPCPDCGPVRRNENVDRCPVCGGLHPGDMSHTRCA